LKIKKEKRDNRKKDTHEFFTPPKLVEMMIKKFPKEMWKEDKTFLDPNAGDGNLLVAVYAKKVEEYGHNPIKALSTIYGVELMADNTAEAKMRLYSMAKKYIEKKGYITEQEKRIIQTILQKNIVCHDALTYNFEFKDLNFIAKNKGKLTHLKNKSGKWFTVEEVIERIRGGTAVRINGGAGVDIIKEGGKEYLRSKKNDTTDDNISSLPEEDYP